MVRTKAELEGPILTMCFAEAVQGNLRHSALLRHKYSHVSWLCMVACIILKDHLTGDTSMYMYVCICPSGFRSHFRNTNMVSVLYTIPYPFQTP